MKFLGYRDPNPPCIPKETGFVGFPDPPTLPSWISQEDVDYYAAKYDKSGFTGPLNYYRSIDLFVPLTLFSFLFILFVRRVSIGKW
ncbi:unnamed protein product [Linum tenue]|nr:unnamed protein product [Linum tenue]